MGNGWRNAHRSFRRLGSDRSSEAWPRSWYDSGRYCRDVRRRSQRGSRLESAGRLAKASFRRIEGLPVAFCSRRSSTVCSQEPRTVTCEKDGPLSASLAQSSNPDCRDDEGDGEACPGRNGAVSRREQFLCCSDERSSSCVVEGGDCLEPGRI